MSQGALARIEPEGVAVVPGRPRAWGWLVHAAWAGVTIATVVLAPGALRWAMVAQWLVLAYPLLTRFAARSVAPLVAAPSRELRPAGLELEADGISVIRGRGPAEVRSRIARAGVAAGWQEPWGSVVLELRSGEVITIAVENTAQGTAILRAVGSAPDQRAWGAYADSEASRRESAGRATIGLTVPLGLLLGTIAFAGSLLRDGARPVAVGAVFGGIALLLIAWIYTSIRELWPRRVIVGTDGVEVRWVGGRELVAFDRVIEAVPDRDGIRLRLLDAGDLLIPCSRPPGVPRSPAGQKIGLVHRDTLLARIRATMAAGRSRSAPAAQAALLERRGRTLSRWREDLARLAREEAGYRDPAVARAELAGVVEDGAAAPEQRVAAAVALASGGDPEVRARVRVVAAAAANEHLRAAMEAAAEGEIAEEELARAERARRRLRS